MLTRCKNQPRLKSDFELPPGFARSKYVENVECITSHRKSDLSIDAYLLKEQSCPISSRSDLKRRSIRLFEAQVQRQQDDKLLIKKHKTYQPYAHVTAKRTPPTSRPSSDNRYLQPPFSETFIVTSHDHPYVSRALYSIWLPP